MNQYIATSSELFLLKCIRKTEIRTICDYTDFDWKSTLKQINLHMLHMCVYQSIGKLNDFILLPLLEAWYRAYKKEVKKKIDAFTEVEYLLNERKIEHCVVKGFVQSIQVYGNPYARSFSDIDIVIFNEEELLSTVILLRKLGYVPYYRDQNLGEYVPQKNLEKTETVLFHEILTVNEKQNISLEIKIATSAMTIDQFKQMRPYMIDYTYENLTFKTFDETHMLLHMLANAFCNSEMYFNSVTKGIILRDYYDIYSYIDEHEVDWLCIFQLARRYDLEYQIKVCLDNFKILFPNNPKIPDFITDKSCISDSNWKYLKFATYLKAVEWDHSFIERAFHPIKHREDYHNYFKRVWFEEGFSEEQLYIDLLAKDITWNAIENYISKNIYYAICAKNNKLFLMIKTGEGELNNHYFMFGVLKKTDFIQALFKIRNIRFPFESMAKRGNIYYVDISSVVTIIEEKQYFRLNLIRRSTNPDEHLLNGVFCGYSEGFLKARA